MQNCCLVTDFVNHEISGYINEKEDSVRVYQIKGTGNVTTWGPKDDYNVDDIIIV